MPDSRPPAPTSASNASAAALERMFAVTEVPVERPTEGSAVGVTDRRPYQPVPWLGVVDAKRAGGTRSRWEAIASFLDEFPNVHSARDLGCNLGFFAIQLGLRGIATTGVDHHPDHVRVATEAASRAGVAGRVAFVRAHVAAPTDAWVVGSSDLTLVLSVWHHVVANHGLATATAILGKAWDTTSQALVFESGADEMPPEFALPPMEPDSDTWLHGYLADTCTGGTVRRLGSHEAFDPSGGAAVRTLFAVCRQESERHRPGGASRARSQSST